MPRKSTTSDPTEYDSTEEGIIESVLDRAMNEYTRGGGAPSRIRVTARIEWGGVEQTSNGGVRSTTLDGLDLSGVQAQLQQSREAREQAEQTRPYTSYDAKGWQAQISELTRNSHGDDAADRAGLTVSRRTLVGWLSGDQEPSKANQQRISEAYDHLRNREVHAAQDTHKNTQHEVAKMLNQAIRQRYGADVRIRDVQDLTFE